MSTKNFVRRWTTAVRSTADHIKGYDMTTAEKPPKDQPNTSAASMSREWHWHPDLPVKYAPYWLWPAKPGVVAKWV